MAMDLPTKTSPSMVELLTLLSNVKPPGLTREEIIQKASAGNRSLVDSAITNCVSKGWLKNNPIEGTIKKRYVLNEKGKAVFNHLPNMKIAANKPAGKPKRKYTKKEKGEVVPRKEIEAEAMPVNISTEANRFADFASDLVTQNAHYRAVLLEIHTTIGKLLFPQDKEQ